MQLQEVDTIQDLKVWVEENMAGAEVYEDMHGTLVIRTNLGTSMGGYLYDKGEEEWKISAIQKMIGAIIVP